MICSTERPGTSAERVPAVRARADLAAVRQRYQGRTSWIVKNPLSLEYFRLLEEEYFLLKQLDGVTSIAAVKRAFDAKFAPQTIDHAEIGRFLGLLHRQGLSVSTAPEQAATLDARRLKARRRDWLERYGNPLAIRIRGFDPEPLLAWLYPKVRWFFSPGCAALCCALMTAALLLIAARFDRFLAALPSFHEFFTPTNAVWLLVTLGIVKVFHELGHGLSCKHFGGESHELGFMLLCFMPTFYCNVTDSWLLPNKWQRAAIGAAGIYVELVLATTAVFVWRFTEPGVLHALALNVVFVCSVSTLVFNANPLLRYDGYYIAGDVFEVTNLGSKARDALRRMLGRACLGLKYEPDPFAPTEHASLFILYAVASSVYRAVVFVSIVWFLNEFFKPYRLDFIGHVLGAAAVVGLLVGPLMQLKQFVSVPGRMGQVNKSRLSLTLSVIGGLLVAAFVVPLPQRVYAPLEVRPRDAQAVYVESEGRIEQALVRAGDAVVAGQPLVRLTNVDLDLDVERLIGRRDEAKVTLASLHQQQFRDTTSAAQIRVAEQTLVAYEQLIAERRRDVERLLPKSPATGTVLPAPEIPPPDLIAGELAEWSGTPLDPRNVGCVLSPGTMLCRIGDSKSMEAVLLVDQGDVEFLALDQTVDVVLDELPGRTWRGNIREIAKTDVKAVPRPLSNKAGGEVVSETAAGGIERPRSAAYQVRVLPLDDEGGLLRIGLRGRAKIYAGRQTLAQMAGRMFEQTFRFEW
jgi:putative peptide zinc metalloprotease protein